jgi:hypothetical protein
MEIPSLEHTCYKLVFEEEVLAIGAVLEHVERENPAAFVHSIIGVRTVELSKHSVPWLSECIQDDVLYK